MSEDFEPSVDELRDAWINESTSFPGEETDDSVRSSESVEAKTREGQIDFSKMSHVMRLCGYEALPGGREAIAREQARENLIEKPTEAATAIPADAEESLADWHRERDRIENERDLEEQTWHEQEVAQQEADDR